MSGVMVILLVDMAVKDCYVFIRHEKIHGFGAVACPPIPVGVEIE
jgi:hypothetical protein